MSNSGVLLGAAVVGAGAAIATGLNEKSIKGAANKVASSVGLKQVPLYKSTRGWAGENGKGVDFEAAVRLGLGYDGGLLVPTFFPQVSRSTLESWYGLSFQDLAYEVISLYVPQSQVSPEELRGIINRSYSGFRHEEVTPVVRAGAEGKGPTILELFHGPTFAFKDVALQFLGNLFEHFLSRVEGDKITVLGATSGDTGSSAIYGLRGKKGVEVFILFPEGRVSPIQERQMITVLDENIHCVAVEGRCELMKIDENISLVSYVTNSYSGTFDDAQAIVKGCFRDREFRDKVNLAAVNSINWARILAQIVYYFYAYLRIVPKQRSGAMKPISFSVPTGNFGDILAGYYAKRMGLPVDQLVVATNENDILHKFFTKGEYFRPPKVTPTISPSMDICVSSNFERFLYHMSDNDAVKMSDIMKGFEETLKLKASDELLQHCQTEMLSERLTAEEINQTIAENFKNHGYLLDPHSAIGVGAATKLQRDGKLHDGVPMVCLACAHWGKFSEAVGAAIGEAKLKEIHFPDELEALKTMETRKVILPAVEEKVKEHVLKSI